MLTEIVRSPRSYFEQRVKYPQLRPQAIIVALAGLVANLWHLALFDTLGASVQYVEDVLFILTVVGVFEFLLIWIVLTGVMHFLTAMLGDGSSYGQLLRLTGYGFLPVIVSGAIWSVGFYLTMRGANPPRPPRTPGFEGRYIVFTEYMAQSAQAPILLAAVAVGSVFLLAAGYLWWQGITVVSEIDEERAGAIAGVALLLFLVRVFVPIL
jgi:hypothetical protein